MNRRSVAAAMAAAAAMTAAPTLARSQGGGSTPLTVAAQIKAKPGKEQELRQALQALVQPTRGEEGVIDFNLHAANEEPGLFLFYENWKSKEDWDRHLKSPHIQAFLEKKDELVADLKILQLTRLT